jgi:hypothetical protein
MTPERIKEIQQETAYPDSISVQQALFKVWNEARRFYGMGPKTKQWTETCDGFDANPYARELLDQYAESRGWSKNKLIRWSEAADFAEWFAEKSTKIQEKGLSNPMTDPEFWKDKQLEAIDPCRMVGCGTEALIVGERYDPTPYENRLSVKSNIDSNHTFTWKGVHDYFKIVNRQDKPPLPEGWDKIWQTGTPTNSLQALVEILTKTPRDVSEDKMLACIYGIIVGWNDASYRELKLKHRWTDKEIETQKMWHNNYTKAWIANTTKT